MYEVERKKGGNLLFLDKEKCCGKVDFEKNDENMIVKMDKSI